MAEGSNLFALIAGTCHQLFMSTRGFCQSARYRGRHRSPQSRARHRPKTGRTAAPAAGRRWGGGSPPPLAGVEAAGQPPFGRQPARPPGQVPARSRPAPSGAARSTGRPSGRRLGCERRPLLAAGSFPRGAARPAARRRPRRGRPGVGGGGAARRRGRRGAELSPVPCGSPRGRREAPGDACPRAPLRRARGGGRKAI